MVSPGGFPLRRIRHGPRQAALRIKKRKAPLDRVTGLFVLFRGSWRGQVPQWELLRGRLAIRWADCAGSDNRVFVSDRETRGSKGSRRTRRMTRTGHRSGPRCSIEDVQAGGDRGRT